ncbi:MAG TPA: transketolase, partial [Paludibacteraceae bacterium]|nr:transketolase [Paludibacteraceae bacterium]
MNTIEQMNKAADNIRILVAAMVEKAKSGHPGGAMGGADFINVLYSEFLEYDPQNPLWEGRDRFFLDPGHMAPMLYAVLAFSGKFSLDDLQQLRQWGSVTPGHPEVDVMRGIENTSGPLGQGHVFAVGAAIAAKHLKAKFGDVMNQTIYAFISDGGIQEEISQGAGRIAGTLGLDNLIMFYDANDIQLSTETKEVTSEDTAKKYEAWGWHVIKIDGHDVKAIREALTAAKAEKERPTLIIGHTIMGKGALKADGSSFERSCATHGAPLGGDAYRNTVKNLGGNPDNAFVFFDETKEIYAKRAAELKEIVAKKLAAKAEWAKANPQLATKLDYFFSRKAPKIDWSLVQQKPDQATRTASATVLAQLAQQVENMVVSSADLSNSDKTDGFLKQTQAMVRGDFSGAFLQAGVAELTMACV